MCSVVSSSQRTYIFQMISVIVTTRIWKGCVARFRYDGMIFNKGEWILE